MKKYIFTFAMLACTTLFAQKPVINGGDFEDWDKFLGGLDSFRIWRYVSQGIGKGMNGSNSLNINTQIATQRNVFSAKGVDNLPANAAKITFWVKGTSTKTLSIHLFRENESYYTFNVKDLKDKHKTLTATKNSNWNGKIDTKGKWVKITLDLKNPTPITDYTTNPEKQLLKVRLDKHVECNLDLDNFEILTEAEASVEKVEIDGFKLYPNPAKNTVNILTKLNDVKEVSLYSVLGKEVLKTSLKGSKLNIKNVAAGIYFIKVVENNKTAYKKLVIK